MASEKDQIRDQQRTVSTVFDLIDAGAAEDLAAVAGQTDVTYLKTYEEDALEYIANKGKYTGVHLGFPHIEEAMGSFLPGELFTIGGDTGHGKSLLAMNMAQNAYKHHQKPVLMVNLELTRNQAIERFYHLSGTDHDYAGIMVQEASSVAYRDIDILMKKAKAEDCCLVVIDHLHFFSRSADNATQELSRIMKHFKECAVENNLPVILLSHVTPTRQMGPDGTVKKVHKPGLHNFKGSSSIEQDSDMVGFVFRDEQNPTEMDFYMRKNRSRPLDGRAISLTQTDWKLEETWWPDKPTALPTTVSARTVKNSLANTPTPDLALL